MKRIFTIFLVLFSLSVLRAQETYLNTDFSGTWPPSGWSFSAYAGNWSAVASSNAGGIAPEARMNWSPQFNGETRMISPALNVSENTSSMLVFSFRHMVNHYSGTYQIGVSVRTKMGPWVTLWTQTVASSISAQTRAIQITDPNLINSDELQFSIFFSGNSFNINYWYIDDVQLVAPADFDLAVGSLNVPTHFLDATPVTGTVTGMGLVPITSFDLNWQIDDGPITTQSFSGFSMAYLQSYNFTTSELIDLDPGTYNLNVSISNINGAPEDDNESNNSRSMLVHVAHQEVQRLPMFESFTSSTCAPCATFNLGFFNDFTQQYQDDLVLVKYQMNWPGSGDPYYTAEGGVRRAFYGVSGVPYLVVEGKQVATTSAAVTSAFQGAKTIPSFMAIEGFHKTEGSNILIEATIMPFADFPNATIHVVVIEGTTTGNVGNNGETSFKHVMMKMLPGANGTTLNLNALEPFYISHNFNMTGTKVEEMNDLKVAIFVQKNSSREVYQAAYTIKAAAPVVNLNIENGATGIAIEPEIIISFNQPVSHLDGSEISSATIGQIIHFSENDQNGQTVAFNADINGAKTQITLQPIEGLAEGQLYYLKLDPLKANPFFNTETTVVTFTTLSTVNIGDPGMPEIIAFPNPASNFVNVRFPVEGFAEMRIIDIGGNLIIKKSGSGQLFQLDVSSLANGVYFLEIQTANNRMMEKISIIR